MYNILEEALASASIGHQVSGVGRNNAELFDEQANERTIMRPYKFPS